MKTILIMLAAITLFVGSNFKTHNPLKPYYDSVKVNTAAETPPPVVVPPFCQGHTDICDAMARSGFTDLRLMMAIAKAESGLRIDALGDTTITDATWGPSVGVLQVRTIKPGHAQGCRIYETLWNNLQAQTDCAKQIYDSQGLNAWSAYTNGSYKKFLADV